MKVRASVPDPSFSEKSTFHAFQIDENVSQYVEFSGFSGIGDGKLEKVEEETESQGEMDRVVKKA